MLLQASTIDECAQAFPASIAPSPIIATPHTMHRSPFTNHRDAPYHASIAPSPIIVMRNTMHPSSLRQPS
ncbi:hypothetical protein BDZ89DRAFT_1059556 [Hymenopellis radicata]|nr:hypothetical protein BDZ89DRAFT_1059556 [Hymenopellis radicata]